MSKFTDTGFGMLRSGTTIDDEVQVKEAKM